MSVPNFFHFSTSIYFGIWLLLPCEFARNALTILVKYRISIRHLQDVYFMSLVFLDVRYLLKRYLMHLKVVYNKTESYKSKCLLYKRIKIQKGFPRYLTNLIKCYQLQYKIYSTDVLVFGKFDKSNQL